MTCKKLIVMVVLLSVILGVDAKAAGRSPRKTEKLYRKAGKWQRKLRDVWALLGVKPFLVQPGEEGDECVLKSKITVDDAADKGDYMLKSTVETDYVLKGAGVFTQGDVDEAVAAALAVKDDEIAANYYHRDFVAAWYVLKTCGPFGSPQDPGYVCFSGPVCMTGPNTMSPGEQCCVTDCDRCA